MPVSTFPYSAVYLVLRDGAGRVLLARRFNTGFMDGFYSLPAGHIEPGESVTAALARETREEIGLALDLAGCQFVHADNNHENKKTQGAAISVALLCAHGLRLSGFFWANTVKLTDKDANTTINARVGDSVEVALQGNPTTGYIWELAPDGGKFISQQGDFEFKKDNAMPGSGGVVTLRFKVTQEGKAHLKLIYHRTFEPNVPPVKTFEADVNIQK